MVALWLYRVVWVVLGPLVDIWFLRRLFTGKEDKSRLRERLGVPSLPRPQGTLVWFHGSSVGETLSILPLINRLIEENPNLHILVTSGTRTSARLMAEKLPPGAIHQYIPLDFGPAVHLFLKHWQPDMSILVESEFWPELLWQAPNVMLINARLSEKSFNRYRKCSFFYGHFLRRIRMAVAQTECDATRLKNLGIGIDHLSVGGNLKYDAPPLGCDGEELAIVHERIGTRPVVVFSSTHPPEEEWFAAVHGKLLQEKENLLTIIIPRHPQRGPKIRKHLRELGIDARLRSCGEDIDTNCGLYIADTLGELGLWYRLAASQGAVVMGGSFIPHGGQNPLESIKLECPTFCGPHMFNFNRMVEDLTTRQLLMKTDSLDNLVERIKRVLETPEKFRLNSSDLDDLSGAVDVCSRLILRRLAEGCGENTL